MRTHLTITQCPEVIPRLPEPATIVSTTATTMCNAIDKPPTQFPKPSAMGKSQTSVMGASLADPCLSNEHDFGMRGTMERGTVASNMCVFRVNYIFLSPNFLFL